MAGWFELQKSSNDHYYFVLKAGNGEVILKSEMYNSRASAENGIASVQINSADESRYDRRTSKNGEPYFALKAKNGQDIGLSQMYKSESSRDNGIASVQNNGQTTTIKDLTTA